MALKQYDNTRNKTKIKISISIIVREKFKMRVVANRIEEKHL